MSGPNQFYVEKPEFLNMEEVKHEYLKDPNGEKLLARLEAIIEVLISDTDTKNTISNYHTEMILSCVLVSEGQYNQVHVIVEAAKQAVKEQFGDDASENVKDVEVYVKRCEVPDACSYALPGKSGHPPIIVINSSLIELMDDNELQAVILHELGHLLYTSSKYIQPMRIMLDVISDGTVLRGALAEIQAQQFNHIRVGFELTADRVMKLCFPDKWEAIQTMFAKLAGGVKGLEINANEFLKQYKKMNELTSKQLISIIETKQEHPPILYRLQTLKEYKYKQP
jgi:Zn-dependent protease with chaperone function